VVRLKSDCAKEGTEGFVLVSFSILHHSQQVEDWVGSEVLIQIFLANLDGFASSIHVHVYSGEQENCALNISDVFAVEFLKNAAGLVFEEEIVQYFDGLFVITGNFGVSVDQFNLRVQTVSDIMVSFIIFK
jgi:hypothetical protein